MGDMKLSGGKSEAAVVTALTKRLDTKTVLDRLSWEIPRGRVVGLLGRNGAGKTTLIECLLGLRKGDKGEVSLLGEDPAELSAEAKSRIGYVPQQSELFEWMTVSEMLGFLKLHYPRWNAAKVEGLLSRWGIDPNLRIAKLSTGEKQKLSIIRALAHDPEFLVLDEPVASLDPAARREFLQELVTSTIERETTVLFSTHILTDLERAAFDIAILHEGRIIISGPLDDVAADVVRLSGPNESMNKCKELAITAPRVRAGVQTFLARLRGDQLNSLPGVRAERLNLEELFIELTA